MKDIIKSILIVYLIMTGIAWLALPWTINSIDNKLQKIIKILEEK
ncbi:hypothetical protein [Anaerosalibacter massiliensis]|nr:hypothetical protein [Anaerosalibacter massiliensis]